MIIKKYNMSKDIAEQLLLKGFSAATYYQPYEYTYYYLPYKSPLDDTITFINKNGIWIVNIICNGKNFKSTIQTIQQFNNLMNLMDINFKL